MSETVSDMKGWAGPAISMSEVSKPVIIKYGNFCELLNEAVKDEATAIELYESLKKKVDEKGEGSARVEGHDLPPEQVEAVKGLIDVVEKQEGKHRELFVAMKEKFCPGW